MTLEQIPLTRCGTSSFLHQPSSPWTKRLHPPRAGGLHSHPLGALRWWQVVAVRVDSLFLARQQKRQWREPRLDLFEWLLLGERKTLRVSASIYNLISGTTTVEQISASGILQVFLILLACSTRSRLRTTCQGHQDYSTLSCSTTKYSGACRMDIPRLTTPVGTRTDYSVGPWDYPTWAARHLLAWSTRISLEKYSDRKLCMSCTV
jgi:hypothetical protein